MFGPCGPKQSHPGWGAFYKFFTNFTFGHTTDLWGSKWKEAHTPAPDKFPLKEKNTDGGCFAGASVGGYAQCHLHLRLHWPTNRVLCWPRVWLYGEISFSIIDIFTDIFHTFIFGCPQVPLLCCEIWFLIFPAITWDWGIHHWRARSPWLDFDRLTKV